MTETGREKQASGSIDIYCPKCSKLFKSINEMLEHFDIEHAQDRRSSEGGMRSAQLESSVKQEPKEEVTVLRTEDGFKELSGKDPSKRVLTKTMIRYLLVGAALLACGIFLENPILLFSSLVPIFFVLFGSMMVQPKGIVLSRREFKSNCYVGEVVEIAVDISVSQGVGYLVIRDVVPKHFAIVEGQDFRVIWKGSKPIQDILSYKVRCTKRGVYVFDCVDYEFRHVLGLRQTIMGQFREPKMLSVQLRNVPIRRIRNTKSLSKLPLPLGALNKTGISTTDFKEIREYTSNDSYKSINWKITSRTSTSKFTQPYVNEFEKEGKKFVWIFIDGSYSMGSYGTVISNAFEHAVAAVNDLSQYYLERDCFVGVYLYNKKHKIIYPDLGRRQRFKIQHELLQMKMDEAQPLKRAIQRCRSYFIGKAPLSIIITALSENNVEDLLDGIKELRKYNKSYVKTSILLVNLKSYSLAATTETDQLSASILQSKDCQIQNRLRQAGIMLVDWNPVTQPLTHVLISEVKRR